VSGQLGQKVPTAILNRTINDAIERRQPVSDQGHRLKFYYATQVRQAPPTFLLFVNRDELFSAPYLKYLTGEMRAAFGYEGCPIVLVPKPRPKTIEPVRKFRKQPFAHKREGGERRLSPLAEKAVARKAARSEKPVGGRFPARPASRPGTQSTSPRGKGAKSGGYAMKSGGATAGAATASGARARARRTNHLAPGHPGGKARNGRSRAR
jgi:hypothetical protein